MAPHLGAASGTGRVEAGSPLARMPAARLWLPPSSPRGIVGPTSEGVAMAGGGVHDMSGFTLGRPALVCRWRLSGGSLVLEGRHMRALAARTVGGARLSQGLLAWARQHVEWTLKAGSAEHPDGVLMLIIDEEGQAAMTVGPYEPLARVTLSALAERAEASRVEAERTGVAPETLWLVQPDELVCGIERGVVESGAGSLIGDLARTMGMRVKRKGDLWEAASRGLVPFDEAFLVSDEHGVVAASDHGGVRSDRFVSSYARLLG